MNKFKGDGQRKQLDRKPRFDFAGCCIRAVRLNHNITQSLHGSATDTNILEESIAGEVCETLISTNFVSMRKTDLR